jgi:hypothetical protein
MLFTIQVTFSDFTFAVEQYEADSAEGAVKRFVEHAESLAAYDKSEWLADPSGAVELIHIGGGLRGAWTWTPRVYLKDDVVAVLKDDDLAVLGGVVIQTDAGGPVRSDAA